MNISFNKLSKLVIVCGGTGGHFYPGLSIARVFKDNGGDVELYLSGFHIESQAKTALSYGIESVKIRSSRSSRNPVKLLFFLTSIALGTCKALIYLHKRKPDAVLAMGSFASAPTAIASILLRIPLFLHDGNAKIGKANRFFSRWAKILAVGFPPVNKRMIKCKTVFTGMPLRPELIDSSLSKVAAIDRINKKYNIELDSSNPSILIFGGSQGAQIFNDNIPRAINKISAPTLQVMHLTGEGKFENIESIYSESNHNVLSLPSTDEMAVFLSAADLIICRSGGSTIAEIAYFGKYSILIPYPYAAENHQQNNAEYLASGDSALIVENSELSVEKAEELLLEWLSDLESFSSKGANAVKLAKPDASADVLKLIDLTIK